MRIVHVIGSLEIGGAEMLVSELSRAHREAGHAVAVHCLFARGVLADSLEADGIAVAVHAPARALRLARRLGRGLREFSPTVIHAHNAAATMLAVAAAQLFRLRAPIVSTRHGLGGAAGTRKRELLYWASARFCDRVVAVCNAARQNFAAAPFSMPARIVTIRNCAARRPRPAGVEHAPGFHLVSVARLAAPKDHATLLRAMRLARAQAPDAELWIVGDGADGAALKRLASELELGDRVHFVGEREDIGAWLARADVFVLSSRSEGLPVSAVEAMAAGLPLLLTAAGGMPELIELSGAGAAVPPGDAAALARAIAAYASGRGALRQLGERSLACYEQHFTPPRMAKHYLDLYCDAVARRGGKAS